MGKKMPYLPIEHALKQSARVVQGHLDMEGFCYIQVVRTSKDECCAIDRTMLVLGKEGFTRKQIQKTWWDKPNWLKWK